MLLVLLQDSDPLVQAVIGDSGPAVPPGAVVVQHPPALPLQRGDAGPGHRRGLQSAEAENRRGGGGQKREQQSVHRCYRVPLTDPVIVVDRGPHLLLTSWLQLDIKRLPVVVFKIKACAFMLFILVTLGHFVSMAT